MNYQLLMECHAAGTAITQQEARLLDLELDSQLASIKVSRTQGCIEIAPAHICRAANVRQDSFWITCFAAILDELIPVAVGEKSRGATVFDELVWNGYLVHD